MRAALIPTASGKSLPGAQREETSFLNFTPTCFRVCQALLWPGLWGTGQACVQIHYIHQGPGQSAGPSCVPSLSVPRPGHVLQAWSWSQQGY